MRLTTFPAETFPEGEGGQFATRGSATKMDARSTEPIDLEPLYRAQAPRLTRFFTRRIGVDDARDLVHECFAGLIRAIGRPVPVEHPEAYLSRTATNLAARHVRTAARRSASLHVPADDALLVGNDLHAQLEARDVLDRLEAAMLRLRPLTRDIFMARRIDGYSYREIAAQTGLSVKRVEKHMARAIAELDHLLGAR
jgi:RNA polymerase sigma-70 factor (ECF subfamily)